MFWFFSFFVFVCWFLSFFLFFSHDCFIFENFLRWALHQSWFVEHESVNPKRQRCSTRLGARVPVLRFGLLGSCWTRPCQSCWRPKWRRVSCEQQLDYPVTHSVSIEEIRVFQACAVVNRWTSGMFWESRRMENVSVVLSRGWRLVRGPLRSCAACCFAPSRGCAVRSARTSCVVLLSVVSSFYPCVVASLCDAPDNSSTHGSRTTKTCHVITSHMVAELCVWSDLPVLAQLKSCGWSGRMVAESGNSMEDERLLGRPCEFNENSTVWNAFKFVFKSYESCRVLADPDGMWLGLEQGQE